MRACQATETGPSGGAVERVLRQLSTLVDASAAVEGVLRQLPTLVDAAAVAFLAVAVVLRADVVADFAASWWWPPASWRL
jgi:hypothetical protein